MIFNTIYPIVKAIARVTQTMVASEVSVSSSDSQVISQGVTSFQPKTPTTGLLDVSRNIVPDYTFYSLAQNAGKKYICGLVEVKKKKFFNDHAVCQTIGYYIAQRSGVAIKLTGLQLTPAAAAAAAAAAAEAVATPLAILFCEDQLRFIFSRSSVKLPNLVLDAVVTPPIAMMNEQTERSIYIILYWFTFIYLYIKDILESTTTIFLQTSDYKIKSHEKDVYSAIMEKPRTDEEWKVQFLSYTLSIPVDDCR